MPVQALHIRAHAKVNLTLEIVRRREDGFHDLCSVFQAISLADHLRIEPDDDLTLRCDVPELEGPENLVWRAAELLQRETSVRRGAALTLTKRMPSAAGLGGGSADAAAALWGLNELWGTGLGREQLMDLGASLGSDVPFFLLGAGCALVEGRGERLTALPALPATWLVLAKPPVGISAAAAYSAFARAPLWSDGERTRAWLEATRTSNVVQEPFNFLETAALSAAPEASIARDALLTAGAPHAVMSGSGSTYFALFSTEPEAQRVHRKLARGNLWSEVAHFASVSVSLLD